MDNSNFNSHGFLTPQFALLALSEANSQSTKASFTARHDSS